MCLRCVFVFDLLKLTKFLADAFSGSSQSIFYLFLGVLLSCADKDIVLESLNLIFSNEVGYKLFRSS
jgi:hypothetical protein